jgi:hypothetical protein
VIVSKTSEKMKKKEDDDLESSTEGTTAIFWRRKPWDKNIIVDIGSI